MRNWDRSFLVSCVIGLLAGNLLAQPTIPDHQLQFVVSSTRGYSLENASVVVTYNAAFHGTSVEYHAFHVGGGVYEVSIPFGGNPNGIIRVEEENHETHESTEFISGVNEIEVVLSHNNYYDEFGVNPASLIEYFGETTIEIDQIDPANGSQFHSNHTLVLPFPEDRLVRDAQNSDRLLSFSSYAERESGYHDILKELVLQTSIMESQYAVQEIQQWISTNLSEFSGHQLAEIELIDLAADFGPLVELRFHELGQLISIAGIVYELDRAASEGLLEALLLVAAYQAYGIHSYYILETAAQSSALLNDTAFRSALERLEHTLISEQNEQLDDIVERMQLEQVGDTIPLIVVSSALAWAFKGALVSLGAPAVVATLGAIILVDLVSGSAEALDMQTSMLLLAQVDCYVLQLFADEYRPGVEPLIAANPEFYYGTLTRIHAGLCYHRIRGNYFSGHGLGFVLAFERILTSTPYTRKMVDVSLHKARQAELDHLQVSSLYPFSSFAGGAGDIALGFIIDSSGSMGENDPQDIRKTAMEIIVNQIDPASDVFIVDFDDSAVWLNDYSWRNWQIDDLSSCIRRIDSSGGTNVGRGIQLLADVWEQNENRSIDGGVLLLSDGMGDYAGQALWFAEQGIPIYTISLVGEENGELLRLISTTTGGKYLKARTPVDIIARFQEFYFSLQHGNRISGYNSTIAQNQTLHHQFEVDQSVDALMCNLSWPGSRIQMRLTDPTGNRFDQQSVQRWSEGDTYAHAMIDNPSIGTWTVDLFGAEIPQAVEAFQLEVYAKSDAVFSLVEDTSATARSSGIVSLRLQVPVGGLNYKSISEEAMVITPSADTLDVTDQITETCLSYRPQHGVGTYETLYKVIAELPGNEIVQRELYHSIYIGEIRPGNIDQVSIVIGNLHIKAPLGLVRGNRPGLRFKVYKQLGDQAFATGHVTSVTTTECTLEIQQFLAPGRVEEGDYIELDPKYWRND